MVYKPKLFMAMVVVVVVVVALLSVADVVYFFVSFSCEPRVVMVENCRRKKKKVPWR